jgi:SAM-dependent methyltransferase
LRTDTDQHWENRAASDVTSVHVNIGDIYQRDLEYGFVLGQLEPSDRILEAGCGNGYSTNLFREHVSHVDGFDYSKAMIDRAIREYGEKNNRFFCDDVLKPRGLNAEYDAVVCVRVLINLANLDEQLAAIATLKRCTRVGGRLILVEGFRQGFEELTKLRSMVGLSAIQPAKINYYSALDDVMPVVQKSFEVVDEFHSGAYDYLTRVVYPVLMGAENAKPNTAFSEKSAELARVFNPDCYRALARVRGFALRRQG